MTDNDAQRNIKTGIGTGITTARRVLYLDHTARWSGGEIALYRFLTALNKSRYEPVVVLGEDGVLAQKLREADICTVVEPLDDDVRDARKDSLGGAGIARKLLTEGPALLGYARRIATIAKSQKCELIHCNSLKSDIYGAIAGRIAAVPVLWHIRDHIAPTYLPPVTVRTLRELSRRLPAHVLCNSRSTLLALFGGDEARAKEPRQAARHSVVWDCVGEDFLRFDAPKIRPAWREPGDGRPLRVGIVGRLTQWKGQHIFLKAMKTVADNWNRSGKSPGLRFVIAGGALFGEDVYATQIHEQAHRDFAPEMVEWCGNVADIPALLSGLDLLIHASITPEPFGQVVIEGMAAGLPVIGTNGGGVPEIIADGETGMLIPMDDAPALANALRALLCDAGTASRMGRAAYREARTRFTSRKTAEVVESVYQRVAPTGRHRENPVSTPRRQTMLLL